MIQKVVASILWRFFQLPGWRKKGIVFPSSRTRLIETPRPGDFSLVSRNDARSKPSLAVMNPITFDDLARLPVIAYYETAFRKVTGMSLKVIAPGESRQRLSFGEFENPFCALVTAAPAGCDACFEAERRAQRTAGKKLSPQQISCFAGLTDVAVPVMVNGRHVATLMSGQIFRRPPTERDFQMVIKMLKVEANADWEKKTRRAYFETLVITPARFEAMVHLLNVFAQYLADFASRHSIAASASEPKPVATAKQFVISHAEDTITLALVARHVNVSRFHFCKMFKKATGMTLTEYVDASSSGKGQDTAGRSFRAHFRSGFRGGFRVNPALQQRVQALCWHAANGISRRRSRLHAIKLRLSTGFAVFGFFSPAQWAMSKCQCASSAVLARFCYLLYSP